MKNPLLILSLFILLSLTTKFEGDSHLQRSVESGRISGDLYSDIAIDPSGNIWISCFEPLPDSRDDRPLILSFHPNGEPRIKNALNTSGRSLCNTVDVNGHVWFAGTFQYVLELGFTELYAGMTQTPFLIRVGQDGAPLEAIEWKGKGQIYHLLAHPEGGFILHAELAGEVQIAGHKLDEEGVGTAWIIRLAEDGRPIWSKRMDAIISDLQIDRSGRVYIGGRRLRSGHGCTDFDGSINYEGFVLALDPKGICKWSRGYGPMKEGAHIAPHSGSTKMIVDEHDCIWLAGIQSSKGAQSVDEAKQEILLRRFDESGNILNERILATDARPAGSVVLANDPNSGAFLTYREPIQGMGNSARLNLLRLDDGLKEWARYTEVVTENTSFRRAIVFNGQLYLSGHYQQYMFWQGQRIENLGGHQLFLLRQSLKE